MGFLIVRTELVHMLSIVTVDSSTPPKARGELVRIHAEQNLLSVSYSGDEARCSALVASHGVCFLRHVKPRDNRVIQLWKRLTEKTGTFRPQKSDYAAAKLSYGG